MKDVFGWTKAVTVRSFFGNRPPQSLDIQVGPATNDIQRVLVGRFEIPGVEGHVDAGVSEADGIPIFRINGKTLKKFQPLFTALATRTREIVAENSIFRNKAFELRFDDDGDISREPPRFLDVADAQMPIFSAEVERSVEANIFNPIRYSERCRELGIPLKRGVLLEGPYGTGKTMLSKKSGQIALENGWTFLKLADAAMLPQAVKFARRFQPAVLFLEDMDEVTGGEDRDQRINEILNTIDGVDSKSVELMVVFTSNHADNINQAMMRPGRLDAIIQISPPDAEACLRLLQLYGRELLDDKLDYSEVAAGLAGTSSAVIREVVERAKLYELSLEARNGVAKGGMKLTPEALRHSITTMKRQMELLADKTPPVAASGSSASADSAPSSSAKSPVALSTAISALTWKTPRTKPFVAPSISNVTSVANR